MMRSIKSRGGLTSGRGLTESVHLQWVYSMHKCAAIHRSMTTLTGLNHDTSDQHIDLGSSRSNRDFHDLNNIQQWFDQHEPFDLTEERLRSLSSGLIAADDDCINCDKVEEIVAKIQEQLDNLSIPVASIRRKDRIQALNHLYPAIQIDKHKVHFNPSILFTQLTAIVQREEDIKLFFAYELTAIPTTLFKDGFMRKPVKSQLAQYLTLNVQSANEPSIKTLQVIDGGALLHRIKWGKKAAYKDIVEQYVYYIRARYGGSSCIVFDGYGYGPSIKDHEHRRRIKKTYADIHLNESIMAHNNQQVFFSNNKNKNQFVQLQSHYLRQDSQIVYNSTGDADTMIVKCALDFAVQGNEVTIVSDDTDILVLLIYHWKISMATVYFKTEANKMMWRVQDLIANAGELLTSHILFVHAWSGCDTTSATFGQGKTFLLKKFHGKGFEELQHISSIFSQSQITAEDVGRAGSRVFVNLYGGKNGQSLNNLQYYKYMDAVASNSTYLDPQKLPPTERAAYFHSLRVHLQIIVWKRLSNGHDDLNPQQWGWKLDGGALIPIMTDLDAAPERLLKFVRCKCKLTSKNPCGSNACSC